LYGFDFENGIYYVNVGEGNHRNWDDCRKFGFLSAGQSWEKWGRKIYSLEVGDVVVAYLKSHGYVGIGKVLEKAKPAIDYRHKGKSLSQYELVQPRTTITEKETKEEEHIVGIQWIKSRPREDAIWKAGLFTSQLVVASLEKQQATIKYLEDQFKVNLEKALRKIDS
jgi:hypothetical protein